MNANINIVNIYIEGVNWKNKLGGVRKVNFSVGTETSEAFYTENRIPKAFPGQ